MKVYLCVAIVDDFYKRSIYGGKKNGTANMPYKLLTRMRKHSIRPLYAISRSVQNENILVQHRVDSIL